MVIYFEGPEGATWLCRIQADYTFPGGETKLQTPMNIPTTLDWALSMISMTTSSNSLM